MPAADGLLSHLGLLFVPPGVIALRQDFSARAWLLVGCAVVLSSAACAILVTGLLSQALLAATAGAGRPARTTQALVQRISRRRPSA